MWINAKKKLATTVIVAACLILTQLEPAAWGKSVQNNTPATPAGAQAQGQTAPPATPAADAPAAKTAAPAKKKSKKLKWLLIGAAVAGAAGGFFLIKNRKKAEPTVTLGGPTVGNPQ